ncbi:MAG: hypothetical protein ACYDHT_07110 [Solirubrobacteraceae bacterium]
MNGVRDALFNLRYRWFGVRIGGPGASMRGQWLALAVAVVVVFGCFYAVGRFLHTGGGSPGAPSALAGAGPSAIPAGLSGGSPVAGAVPVAIAVKPRPRVVVQAPEETNLRAAAGAQTFSSEEASAGSLSSGEQQSPSEAASSEAPNVETSQPAEHKGQSASARRRARASQPSGPVTFDTSE